MSYADFAMFLSMIVVTMYFGLFAITLRRAQFGRPRPEPVATRVRSFEGPIITVLFIAAICTGVASFLIGTPNYAQFAGWFIAGLRGGLFVLGFWLYGYYWTVRVTWM